jgi:hypothetical protein
MTTYPFHQNVQEVFPDFDYHNVQPSIKERLDYRRPDNVVGHQQRAVSCYWALKMCSALDLGLDLGSPKGLTPHCIHVDLFGDGRPHPFYGGGPYIADIAHDACRTAIFPENAWPYITSNHSLEHMNVGGDGGIVSLLEKWIALLRPSGILAMVIPDNDHFNVMKSDANHASAWGASDFKTRVLNQVLARSPVELVEYNTLLNNFSFNVVLARR